MGNGTDWTTAQDEALKGFVAQGLSFGLISIHHAEAIGHRSRNAIIGRSARLKLKVSPLLMTGNRGFWTKSKLDHLSRLYLGVIPYDRAELAAELGCSERQIGLGIAKLNKSSAHRMARKRKPVAAGAPKPRPALPPQPAPASDPVTFLDLAFHHCRYIVSEDNQPVMYCGAGADERRHQMVRVSLAAVSSAAELTEQCCRNRFAQ